MLRAGMWGMRSHHMRSWRKNHCSVRIRKPHGYRSGSCSYRRCSLRTGQSNCRRSIRCTHRSALRARGVRARHAGSLRDLSE